MPSVVVADVVPLVRLGLATVLRSEGFEVVAEVASARGGQVRRRARADLAVVGAVNDLSVDEMARQVHDAAGCGSWCCWVVRATARRPAGGRGRRVGEPVDRRPTCSAVERVMAGERYVDPVLLTGDAPDEEFEPMALTAPRARGARPPRLRVLEPRDRVDALRVAAHGEDPPRAHLRQARRPEPQRGTRSGDDARPAALRSTRSSAGSTTSRLVGFGRPRKGSCPCWCSPVGSTSAS